MILPKSNKLVFSYLKKMNNEQIFIKIILIYNVDNRSLMRSYKV